MRKDWLYYIACLIAPHIMIIVGLVFLARADLQKKRLGKSICMLSTLVLIAGSLVYYILFTPIFGLD